MEKQNKIKNSEKPEGVDNDLYFNMKDVDGTDAANKFKFNLTKKQDAKNVLYVMHCVGVSSHYALIVDINGSTYELF